MRKFCCFVLVASLVSMASPVWSQCAGCTSSAPVFSQGYSSAMPVQYSQGSYGQVYDGAYQTIQPAMQYGTYTSGQMQTFASGCGVGCGQTVSHVGGHMEHGNVVYGSQCCPTAGRSGLLSNRGRFVGRRASSNCCPPAVYTTTSGTNNCGVGCGQVVGHTGFVSGCGTGCGQIVQTSGCESGCGGMTVVADGHGTIIQENYDVVAPPNGVEPTPAVPVPDTDDET